MQTTIAALATPPLSSALAIIRISGLDSFKLAGGVFFAKNRIPITEWKPNFLTTGQIIIGGYILDDAMAVRFIAPYSSTGEDMVELHMHGSMPVIRVTLETLFDLGASQAAPGEFTKRAFLHGKLSLSQAEAVCDLVSAETRDAARNAAGQLSGAVGKIFAESHDALANLLAGFYAHVDYPEDDIDAGEPDVTLAEILKPLEELLKTAGKGLILKEGLRCAIIGKPNVGKSSLLNAFSGYDRAIVSKIPGTTRDTIEETITLGGIKLRVADGAGIRETEDVLEAEGVSRAKKTADEAELLFVVLDGSGEISQEDRVILDFARDKNCIILLNKSDKPQKIEREQLEAAFLYVLPISAKTGEGMESVFSAIRRLCDSGEALYDGSVLTNERQADAIRRTADAIRTAIKGLRCGITSDAVLGELELALAAIGELTGRRVREEIIDEIFSKFCVGK